MNLFANRTMQRLSELAAWLLALAIVALSRGPLSTRPVTGTRHNLEHILAFILTGVTFALGYPCRIQLPTTALGLPA
jgi:hypothetical protein